MKFLSTLSSATMLATSVVFLGLFSSVQAAPHADCGSGGCVSVHDVIGNGDCMYTALAHLMNTRKFAAAAAVDDAYTADILRTVAGERIANMDPADWDEWRPFLFDEDEAGVPEAKFTPKL